MILLVVAAVAIAIGLARGGRLEGLSKLQLRGAALILGLFVLQFSLRQVAPMLHVLSPSALVLLWCGVSLGLLASCVVNRRIRGMPLIAVGIALNLAVVALNAGMPAGGALAASLGMSPSPSVVAAHGGFYRIVDSETVAAALGDVVPIPAPRPLRSLVSIGDVLMFLGAGVLIEEGVREGRYRAKHGIARPPETGL